MMPVFVIINWTQFFMIPALTMRSIADEKTKWHYRTDVNQTDKNGRPDQWQILFQPDHNHHGPTPNPSLLYHYFYVGGR